MRNEKIPVVTPPRKDEGYLRDSLSPSAQGSRGRPLISAMTPTTQENVKSMKEAFKIYILSENAFPDRTTAKTWIINRCREDHNSELSKAQLNKVNNFLCFLPPRRTITNSFGKD